jgi:hypothetical protein
MVPIMSRDVVVHWTSPHPIPQRDQLERFIEDYVRGVATQVYWDKDRFFIDLPGGLSFACTREPPDYPKFARDSYHHANGDPRWIEVWSNNEDAIYVMTRRQDDITNAIADGFGHHLARAFRGRVLPG